MIKAIDRFLQRMKDSRSNLVESTKEYLIELSNAKLNIKKKIEELKVKSAIGKRKNKLKKSEKITQFLDTLKTIHDDLVGVETRLKENIHLFKYNVS